MEDSTGCLRLDGSVMPRYERSEAAPPPEAARRREPPLPEPINFSVPGRRRTLRLWRRKTERDTSTSAATETETPIATIFPDCGRERDAAEETLAATVAAGGAGLKDSAGGGGGAAAKNA